MDKQSTHQKKPAPTHPHPTKTSVKSPVHQEDDLQGAIGNRQMGLLMETHPHIHPSSLNATMVGEMPMLGGMMPVSQGRIQRQPLFGGLSQEMRLENASLALPATGALVQRKLTLGTPGDMYEEEADRVARQVVDEIHSSPIREQNAQSEEERKPAGGEAGRVQRQITVRSAGDAGGELSSEWEGELQRAKSGGQPLSPSVKEPMERAFGADFGGVRVHTGAQADMLARSIQAKAFTTGQDVFFRKSEYAPGSRGGQELIAHELTHVVQQKGMTLVTGKVETQTRKRLVVCSQIKESKKAELPEKESRKRTVINYLYRQDRATINRDDSDGEDENIKMMIGTSHSNDWLNITASNLGNALVVAKRAMEAQAKQIGDSKNRVAFQLIAGSVVKMVIKIGGALSSFLGVVPGLSHVIAEVATGGMTTAMGGVYAGASVTKKITESGVDYLTKGKIAPPNQKIEHEQKKKSKAAQLVGWIAQLPKKVYDLIIKIIRSVTMWEEILKIIEGIKLVSMSEDEYKTLKIQMLEEWCLFTGELYKLINIILDEGYTYNEAHMVEYPGKYLGKWNTHKKEFKQIVEEYQTECKNFNNKWAEWFD